MKFIELKNDIAQVARGIYLLEGDDAYFRTKAEEQIKAAFLEMPELNFTSFDGSMYKGANLSEITSAVQSFPFMAPKRVIKIIEFYPTETDYDKYLKDTFENLPDTTILIIVNTQAKKGVDLKRKKSVTFVDCDKADADTVTKWAYLTLKRAGVQAEVEACEAIAAYCLNDMARVSVEVEKFIALKKAGVISKTDVDELVYKDADYRIYEMTNAISRKNYSAFTVILYDLKSKGFDENAILSSLFNYFKNLLTICTSNKSEKELAELLKMKEYGVKKSGEQAQVFGKNRLVNYVESLYSLISDIKSGRKSQEGALFSALSTLFFS
jgi:DNA polymerase III delta subunit